MNVKLRLLVVVMMFAPHLHAQSPDQISNYIKTYKSLAIAEMQRTGIPASIILAQGIHETQAGTSDLVIASNNHFGIKCKDNWNGKVVYHDDDARGECFRSYTAAADSYRDHSDFLINSPRYAFLFKLNPEDYESWAYGLKKAGYATNIKYSEILIRLIHEYDLQKYSFIALGKLPPEQSDSAFIANETKRETVQGFFDTTQIKTNTDVSYPEGQFSINFAKVIYARSGTSLLVLSNQYNIPLARLLEFNDLKEEDVLVNDQLIFLQRKRKIGSTEYHVTQTGESMYIICQAEGIRYESILELNHLVPGEEPAPGEKIYLQSMAGTKPVLRNTGIMKTGISAR
ncbi:MAG TPA: glucosaminidase domain-containing protein [Puia sp.]|nr:glucosaminidase domain-containing protein [Puia sp.]